MKNLIPLLSFILLINLQVFAQTDGLNYQAVIIDPNPEEIPGIDVTGNILPNKEINVIITNKKLSNQSISLANSVTAGWKLIPPCSGLPITSKSLKLSRP